MLSPDQVRILGRGKFGARLVIVIKATVAVAWVTLTAIAVAGCSSQSTSIVGDDAALCQYSTDAGSGDDISRCRGRLDDQHRRLTAGNATRIDGYALLNTPEQQPSAVVDRCKTPNAPKDCGAGDITGTIPAGPRR